MNNKGEKFLPLGSIVILSGSSKRLMIIGFCTMDIEKEFEIYDYCGCAYPEGMITNDQVALFNHDQIEKIYHIGFSDQEDQDYKEHLVKLLKQTSEELNNNLFENKDSKTVKEDPVPPIGPGLPGYVVPAKEDSVPPIGPGLPGYVVPAKEDPVPPIGPGLPGYVVPAKEDPVPPIGPELPGYVNPSIESPKKNITQEQIVNYRFD